MKYILLIASILFLSACSPKYKVVKEYHPPKLSQDTQVSVCLGLCENKKTACASQCEATFSECKVNAHRVAKKRYAVKMQKYTAQLEAYVDEMNMNHFDIHFQPMGYYGYPFYSLHYDRSLGYGYANKLFWYDPMPYYSYAPKPAKPSLAQEKLKAEAELCELDCGCTQSFDSCYRGCGGEVVSKKICIENCPNGN